MISSTMDGFCHFWTILRDISTKDKLELRCNWGSCQWSSTDGTNSDLFEMFKNHGTPGSVEIVRLDFDP